MTSVGTPVANDSFPWISRVLDWTSRTFDVQDPHPRSVSSKCTAVGPLLPPREDVTPACPPSSAGRATTAPTPSAEDNGGCPTVSQQHEAPAVRKVQAAAPLRPMEKIVEETLSTLGDKETLPAHKEEVTATAPSEKHVRNNRRRKRDTRQEVSPPPPQQQQQQQQQQQEHEPPLLEKEAAENAALWMGRVKLAEQHVSKTYKFALKLSDAASVLEKKKDLAIAQAGPLMAATHIAACKLKLAQAGESAAKAQCESHSRPGRVIRSWMEKWDIGPLGDMAAATRRLEEATQVYHDARMQSELAWDQVTRSRMELDAMSTKLEEAQGPFDNARGMLIYLERKADYAATGAAAAARSAEVSRRFYEARGGDRNTESQPSASRTAVTLQDDATCYEQMEPEMKRVRC